VRQVGLCQCLKTTWFLHGRPDVRDSFHCITGFGVIGGGFWHTLLIDSAQAAADGRLSLNVPSCGQVYRPSLPALFSRNRLPSRMYLRTI
jgi:hypothetical protein